MSNVMIVGATRGIGLELTKQYADEGNNVIACARDTDAASLLDELTSGSDNITIEQLDIADPSSIEAAAGRIGDDTIDTVIIVAGAVGGDPTNQQSIDNIDIEEWPDRSRSPRPPSEGCCSSPPHWTGCLWWPFRSRRTRRRSATSCCRRS